MNLLIQNIRPHATLRTIKKGSTILFQGEIPRSVFIIRDGFVRAYTVTSSGEERTIALYGKDDVFPYTWIIGETNQSMFYYEAMSDVRVLTATKSLFIQSSSRTPEALNEMLRYIGNQYTALLFRITGLEQSRAIEKIGYTLYYLLFRYGKQTEEGIFCIEIKLTQAIIASLVGLTRESTTKNLKVLKQKDIITYDKYFYCVNKTKLELFLKEDSFKDLQLS